MDDRTQQFVSPFDENWRPGVSPNPMKRTEAEMAAEEIKNAATNVGIGGKIFGWALGSVVGAGVVGIVGLLMLKLCFVIAEVLF